MRPMPRRPLTEEQRQKHREAIRRGIARRFEPVSPEEQQRRDRLGRRRALRNLLEQDAGPRCGVCGLLEPHTCLDEVEVRPI
jgi:hypothetical protein